MIVQFDSKLWTLVDRHNYSTYVLGELKPLTTHTVTGMLCSPKSINIIIVSVPSSLFKWA